MAGSLAVDEEQRLYWRSTRQHPPLDLAATSCVAGPAVSGGNATVHQTLRHRRPPRVGDELPNGPSQLDGLVLRDECLAVGDLDQRPLREERDEPLPMVERHGSGPFCYPIAATARPSSRQSAGR